MSDSNKLAYSLGFNIGMQLRGDFPGLTPEDVARGIEHAYNGTQPELEVQEMQAAIQEAQIKAQQAQQEAMAAAGEANQKASEEFLAETAKREGVTTTESGLQYEVMQIGSEARKPAATDTVTVHYHGTLPNGEVFDSSVQRGEPATFGLNQVIRGWTEGVQLMDIGSKFRFFIPADLAYGPNGAGGAIGPNQALVFEVELLEIAA